MKGERRRKERREEEEEKRNKRERKEKGEGRKGEKKRTKGERRGKKMRMGKVSRTLRAFNSHATISHCDCQLDVCDEVTRVERYSESCSMKSKQEFYGEIIKFAKS